MLELESDVIAIDALAEASKKLETEIAKVIVGQNEVVKSIIISIFSNGHPERRKALGHL